MAVENGVHDAISPALDNVVTTGVKTVVISITESSELGPSRIVQNPDERDFTGNTVNTPLMSASS